MDKRFMSHDQALETTTAIDQLPANGDCAYKCDSQSEWLLCSYVTISHNNGQFHHHDLSWSHAWPSNVQMTFDPYIISVFPYHRLQL